MSVEICTVSPSIVVCDVFVRIGAGGSTDEARGVRDGNTTDELVLLTFCFTGLLGIGAGLCNEESAA